MNLQENISNLLLIYTGGTIGMVEDPETGVFRAFNFEHLQNHVPELKRFRCRIEVLQFDPPIDSSAIDPSLWVRLAQTITERYQEFDGFVVLHGTDTMAYSSSALSFLLPNLDKPVVFTGSQLPIGTLRTDGKENLITAIEIALAKNEDGSARVPEVCVFFDDCLMRGNRTTKESADQFKAFVSHNYPPLAYAGIDIEFRDKYIGYIPEVTSVPHSLSLDPNIVLLYLFPGITSQVVESILSIPHLKGVVLATYGSGNAPTDAWFLSLLKSAIDRGIVVVNVTQCPSGKVNMDRYETGHSMPRLGVVSGWDMTIECALTKLMYLLGQNISAAEVAKYMEIPFRGELTR